MRDKKHNRIEKILHRLAAEFVRREASDSSLLTITRVQLSPTGREARVFFTTLPESKQETARKFLERKTPDFKSYVRDNSRIGIIPRVDFTIDFGERNRQRLDELSNP